MNRKCILMILLAGLIFADMTPCLANDTSGKNEESFAGGVFLFPVELFAKYISRADGDRCPMYPSCSGYSKEAVKKHGPLIGWIMTCDRLMRCGRDEKNHSPSIAAGEKIKTFDPVSNNDFWWDKSGRP